MFVHDNPSIAINKGFTLIELVIVMTIIGIVALFAINLTLEGLLTTQTRTTTKSLIHILTASRSQAVSLFTNVIVCPSHDDQNCHSNWSDNLISFIDHNKNNRRDDNEPINFRHYSAPELTISYTRTVNLLKFNPAGRLNNIGSFMICPNNGDDRLIDIIIINRQGRVRKARDTDGDGVVEMASGSKASCPES